jgi:hypothetical protein
VVVLPQRGGEPPFIVVSDTVIPVFKRHAECSEMIRIRHQEPGNAVETECSSGRVILSPKHDIWAGCRRVLVLAVLSACSMQKAFSHAGLAFLKYFVNYLVRHKILLFIAECELMLKMYTLEITDLCTHSMLKGVLHAVPCFMGSSSNYYLRRKRSTIHCRIFECCSVTLTPYWPIERNLTRN